MSKYEWDNVKLFIGLFLLFWGLKGYAFTVQDFYKATTVSHQSQTLDGVTKAIVKTAYEIGESEGKVCLKSGINDITDLRNIIMVYVNVGFDQFKDHSAALFVYEVLKTEMPCKNI